MLISRMVAMQKLTSRFCLSTGHFCQAAEEILTQHSTKNALQRNTSFNVKLHVPVGFWGMCNLDQLTHSLNRLYYGFSNSQKEIITSSFSKINLCFGKTKKCVAICPNCIDSCDRVYVHER